MKKRTDLNLGEVFYISIIFHIPASSSSPSIFISDGVTLQTSRKNVTTQEFRQWI